MIRITGIKIDAHKNQEAILQKEIISTLRIKPEDMLGYKIYKQSIDARKKDKIHFIYTVDVTIKGSSKKVVEKCKDASVSAVSYEPYADPAVGEVSLSHPPIIIGAGPAGLLAALTLARLGYTPLLLERGQDVEQRTQDVEDFWQNGQLNPESNVQFGEGGAGTFSDGKLTTLIKDNRCRKVLETLIEHKAPEDILYSFRPHIGTDVLKKVVKNMREEIIALGGEVRFGAKVTNLVLDQGQIQGVVVNGTETIPSEVVILAVGHSARDTFAQLLIQGVEMVPKAFSIGVRIEHLQSTINKAQYGKYAHLACLGAADYKLSHKAKNGRNVYTFCMCPGGTVVAAASEEGGVVTNGMSVHARDGHNANSAIVVGVNPSDFGGDDPLAGVNFQRHWEQLAYQLAGGNFVAPVQLVEDFLADTFSDEVGKILPSYTPSSKFSALKECLPDYVVEALQEAIPEFGKKIKGFNDPEAILTGVETRTSSPLRILRNEGYQSVNIAGLYPCGEGAGYAGGIISAAVDGMRVAEEIIKQYAPLISLA